ncbi:MAG: asparagine synthase (glutamine-hydrolyzing), partial [Candidatus Lindowbacteria bacterium]|nr:asparagine synthase (glutamine-hydrolyzing) [Candidatus Lindowbacteria bacterium]
MCGIAGILNFDRAPVDARAIEKMTHSLRHRGPDFEDRYVKGSMGFGHTRLSIIDLSSAGNQPMATDDKNFWIVYNGELYNYKDIKAELSREGYSFRSDTDTEVVLKSYQHWGPKCLDRFNGMFAFAVWDEAEQTLFLARDRMGEKPLYYWQSGTAFAFASEIKALLQHDAVKREIDFSSFDNYLTLRYVPGPNTIFKNIQKLPPAHYMLVRDSKVETKRYWDFEFVVDSGRTEQEWEEEFYDLLKDSVKRRLMSDVPLGVFLSGGVDSTMITGLMRQLEQNPINTFSVGFETEVDERPVARAVSEHFGTTHREFVVNAEDFSRLPEII